jgi:hypothetical protein
MLPQTSIGVLYILCHFGLAPGNVDVSMTDVTSSIQKMVDKTVNTSLKKLSLNPSTSKRKGKGNGKKQSGGGGKSKADLLAQAKVRLLRSSYQSVSHASFPGAIRQNSRQTSRGQTPVRPSSLWSSPLQKLNIVQDQEGTARKRKGKEAAGGRQRKGKRKARSNAQVDTRRSAITVNMRAHSGPSIAGASNLHASAWEPSASNHRQNVTLFNRPGRKTGSFIAEGDLWMSSPSLIPDYLLSIPAPAAINITISKMSLDMISNLSYQQDVHCSPDVHLPRKLAYQISVGSKYMFHKPSNSQLIGKAWRDFNRHL